MVCEVCSITWEQYRQENAEKVALEEMEKERMDTLDAENACLKSKLAAYEKRSKKSVF